MTPALFDLDGTITTRDTLLDFARFAGGGREFLKGMIKLSPKLVLYRLNLYRNDRMKESFLTHFFGGMDESEFKAKAKEYALTRMKEITRSDKRALLDSHKAANDRVVVVSASAEDWVAPWCLSEGIEFITTRLEKRDGKVTGRLATPNCYGPEKLRRVKSYLNLSKYDKVYVYGNSRGDREMESLRTANLDG